MTQMRPSLLTDSEIALEHRIINCFNGIRTPIDRVISLLAEAKRTGVSTKHILWICADKGRYDLIPVFVQYGADVNYVDHCGKTPLMHLTDNYNFRLQSDPFKCASVLLALGADKDLVDSDGMSAYGHFCWKILCEHQFNTTFGFTVGMHIPKIMTYILAPQEMGHMDRVMHNITKRNWTFEEKRGYALCDTWFIPKDIDSRNEQVVQPLLQHVHPESNGLDTALKLMESSR